jgi:hypothetical protein
MARRTLSTAAAVACVTAAAVAATARADTGDIIAPQHNPPTAADGWQAATCNTDVPECSPQSPGVQFSTQAATHPPIGFTQFIIKEAEEGGLLDPVGLLKDVRVDLPVGLSVNPQATPQCDLAAFKESATNCPPTSVVGASLVTLAVSGAPVGPVPAQVYNLVPEQGEPALFGFEAAGAEVFLKSDVEWAGDYHEGFTIAVAEPPIGRIYKNRLVFTGIAGNGTFLTNPSTCHDPAQPAFQHTYSTFLRADSYEAPNPNFPAGSTPFEAALPPGVKPTGCEAVPFEPGIEVQPGTQATDSPDGAAATVTVPFNPLLPIADSNVETAHVSLPLGMGLNPASADQLQFCADDQFNKGSRAPVNCPPASKIGTVSIQTPPLPPDSLNGDVFLGKQLSRDPTSGEEYRIFVDAESARFGVSVRLIGKVKADPKTGRLTTTFAEAPQVPFTAFKLDFLDGPKAVLTSAPSCGPNTSNSRITPYSGTPDATPSQAFTLTQFPGGGACPKTPAERPFTPGFSTSSKSFRAGAFSTFAIHISRSDGQQEIKGTDFSLPPGVTGKLKGIPYCPAKALASAGDRSGEAERKKASCPGKSQVGVATINAGSGPSPVSITGNANLAGPYRKAPLSLAVVTPAVAGPFDLGTEVVRVPLMVEPESARIHPLTNAIPDVFGGAKLDLRSIDVNTNRPKFIINPTGCRKLSTAGSLIGGGADPTDPATFRSFAVKAPFKAKGCKRLRFHPRFSASLFGSRKDMFRNHNPKLTATLVARHGDANLRRASVALPPAIILDQRHIGTLCTRPQLAANECPKASIKGFARATSPLIGKPLKGPVYLVPGKHVLPDLLVDLKGQVDVRLRGATKTTHGRLRNTFDMVPDVPVSKFALTIFGGKRGVLLTSSDLCRGRQTLKASLKAQNGRHLRPRGHHGPLLLGTPACHGGGHGHH